ncbi:hypothetical protein [Dictyobacter aurantiacus]|uniref:Uncharacterized protein n=1 Tax=Dictyobacter aurantiacus TaxID=1936993 RepID=A0A401Z7S2_9CHLR|nr:hypothetical protein [Dictyobacter aurantiacus]GCE02911.1 hypothetical protein KDAU_02400 [Dictyobacter aurantiacus]
MCNYDVRQHLITPQRGFHALRRLAVSAVIFCGLLLLLTNCRQQGQQPVRSHSVATHPAVNDTRRLTQPDGGAISFRATTSYATALRIVTNLGLQLAIGCAGPTLPWQPIGSKDYFKVTHAVGTSGKIGATPTVTYYTYLPTIMARSTPLTPANWQARLLSNPEVANIKRPLVLHCPMIPTRLPAEAMGSLTQKQAGTYVNVHFAANVTYDDALYAAQNNGFRLANYCYEHEPGQPADWLPMSQDQIFAHSHTLIVATTILSSTDWAKRMVRVQGVISLQYPFSSACS